MSGYRLAPPSHWGTTAAAATAVYSEVVSFSVSGLHHESSVRAPAGKSSQCFRVFVSSVL